jgi:hypothetical protein
MSPVPGPGDNGIEILNLPQRRDSTFKPLSGDKALVLEGWAEGFMVGALIIMSCITLANMRRGVLLHKLILLEVNLPSKRIFPRC